MKFEKNVFEKAAMRKIAAFLLAVFCFAPVSAATLSTNFADVFVDNLKIGGSYNLTEVANMPMWIGYRGTSPAELKIDVVAPTASELKSGYEPVPDPSWITVSKKTLSLFPDENANLDVTISVPNDGKYLGKKYQAYVHVASVPPKDARSAVAVSLALKGRVLFGTAAKAPTESELRELLTKKARAQQGVSVSPERFEVKLSDEGSAAGGRTEVTEYAPLKIINSSTEKVGIAISAALPDASGISLPGGYAAGATSDLVFGKSSFSMRPDSIENVRVFIKAGGSAAANASAKKFYVVRIMVKSKTIEAAKYVRIYAE